MAQLILENLEQDIVEKLELRAKRLGTTPQEEASRLLRQGLGVEPEPAGGVAAPAAEDPRFVREDGFLVFTGAIAADTIPDHRALRDERVDSLLIGADEGRV